MSAASGGVRLALRKERTFVSVVSVSALSQALAAGGVILLPVVGGRYADAYVIGVQVGSAPLAGIVMGVVYNITIGRRGFAAWNMWIAIAIGFACLQALVVAILVVALGSMEGFEASALTILVLFGVGGGILAWSGIKGVEEACHGNPIPLAAVSIVPNAAFFATIATTAILGYSAGPSSVAPAAIWLVSCIGIAVFYVNRYTPDRQILADPPGDHSRDPRGLNEHIVASTIGTVAATILPTVYAVALTQLGAGVAAFTYLVVRICGSAVNLVVGSLLLVRYDWNRSTTPRPRLVGSLTAYSALCTALGLIACAFKLPLLGYIVITVGLPMAMTAAMVTMRECAARALSRSVSVKVAADLFSALVLSIALVGHPSVSGYFGAFLSSNFVTVAICAYGLGWFRVSRFAAIGWVMSAGLVVASF